MLAFTFLGTAPGVPVVDRFHNSILLEAPEGKVLLDVGEPCSHLLKARGESYSQISAILISHGHSDHIGGLPMVLQGAWLEGRTDLLRIYLPGELIVPLQQWLEAVYLPGKLLGFPIKYSAWEDITAAETVGLRVTPHYTTHLESLHQIIDPSATGRFMAYGMEIECGDLRVVYSADLGKPQDLDQQLATPVDALICEMSHCRPEDLFGYLADKPISELYLTHMSPEIRSRVDEVLVMAKQMLPQVRVITAPSDGETVSIGK